MKNRTVLVVISLAAGVAALPGCGGSTKYNPAGDATTTIQQSNGPVQMAPEPSGAPGGPSAGANAPSGG